MQWVKIIGTAVIVLCLFIGGIAFDIFVVQHFTNKNIVESKQSNQTEITQNIEVTNKVKSNLLKMSVGITPSNKLFTTPSLTEEQRENIIQQLNSILKLSQTYKNICRYQPYVFEPRSNYVGQDLQIRGYNVRFNIDCKMQETEYSSYEEFISQVKKIVYKDSWLDFRIKAFDFDLTESLQKEQDSILRKLAIKNANDLVAEYGKNLETKCTLASMSFGQNAMPINMLSEVGFAPKSLNYENSTAQFDLKTLTSDIPDLPVSLNANLRILCEK